MESITISQIKNRLWVGMVAAILCLALAGCDQALTPLERGGKSGKDHKMDKSLRFLSPGEIIQVTSDTSDQMSPDLSYDRLVFADNRNGNFDIFAYCLSSRRETQITDDPEDQLEPAISNGQIVWEDQRVESGQDIFYYDLRDQSEVQLTTTAEPYNETAPEIEGDYAMWYQGFRWYYDVYNSAEQSFFTIGVTGPGDGGYGISGDRAVLTGYGGSDPSDLYLCDLSQGSDSGCELLFHEDGRASNPDIDGDYVVWQDDRNGNLDIFFYDISTEEQTQITSDPADQRAPQISGDYVTWVDSRDGNDDIYLYNAATQEEIQVTSDTTDQRNPAIFGNYVVWEDSTNGNWDIYLYKIAEVENGYWAGNSCKTDKWDKGDKGNKNNNGNKGGKGNNGGKK